MAPENQQTEPKKNGLSGVRYMKHISCDMPFLLDAQPFPPDLSEKSVSLAAARKQAHCAVFWRFLNPGTAARVKRKGGIGAYLTGRRPCDFGSCAIASV